MRTYLKNYGIVNCNSLKEALQKIHESTDIIPLAGGTDLLVTLNSQKMAKGTYLNLYNIPELQKEIQVEEDKVVFSALTTYTDVRLHPFFQKHLRLLFKSAIEVGSIGIQNRGTWAGNIMNASPAADGVAVLIIYDAKITLKSLSNEREVLLSDFYHGYKKMDRQNNEIITQITIPIQKDNNRIEYFRKVGDRKAQTISKVSFAGSLNYDSRGFIQNSKLVFGSVMPFTYRSSKLEDIINGKKLSENLIKEMVLCVKEEIHPIDDIRSNARYRMKVAQNLLEEFLTIANEQISQKISRS